MWAVLLLILIAVIVEFPGYALAFCIGAPIVGLILHFLFEKWLESGGGSEPYDD